MDSAMQDQPEELQAEAMPPLQLRAFTFEDRRQMMRHLPVALNANGAWLLRSEVISGVMRFSFEFERSNSMNIYVMLVAAGLELTRNSHLALTCFCQRTQKLAEAERLQVAACELEVCELIEETLGNEVFFGANSIA